MFFYCYVSSFFVSIYVIYSQVDSCSLADWSLTTLHSPITFRRQAARRRTFLVWFVNAFSHWNRSSAAGFHNKDTDPAVKRLPAECTSLMVPFYVFFPQSPCESFPCQNGGICLPIYEEYAYECSCTSGYFGPNCQEKCEYLKFVFSSFWSGWLLNYVVFCDGHSFLELCSGKGIF